jgi:uncharacterized membrane protein
MIVWKSDAMNEPTLASRGVGPAEPRVRAVATLRPLHWLALGWRDFTATPVASGAHGVLVTLGGFAILALALRVLPLLPGAFSGFVLIGPILATGLYEISRRRGLGERPTFADAMAAWRRGTRPLVWLGLLLLAAATAWVLASSLLFGVFVHQRIDTPVAFLRYAVVEQGPLAFLLWVVLGGLGSALVFALTAVSPPLLLEREIALRPALLASARAVGDNPMAMAVWAAIIMVATALSIATALVGFVVAIPVIGHATWHAYRDLIDADCLPLRH